VTYSLLSLIVLWSEGLKKKVKHHLGTGKASCCLLEALASWLLLKMASLVTRVDVDVDSQRFCTPQSSNSLLLERVIALVPLFLESI
jgi:hypothetical protein